MFQSTKRPTPLKTEQLIPVLSAKALLAAPHRQHMLDTIAQTSQFTTHHYEHIVRPVIDNVAFYYQQLPEGSVYFSHPFGWIDHILSRTVAATTLLRQYLLPPPYAVLSTEQQRWWYALCSASLLRGIGTLMVDYRIHRYNQHEELIKPWEPLFEPIGQVHHYYSYELTHAEQPGFKQRLTLLLAQTLMPSTGLEWLASNKEIFAIWLALLSEHTEDARALGAILDRADAQVIQTALLQPQSPLVPAKRSSVSNTFIDIAQESLAHKEQAVALEFIRWLQAQLEHGRFILNKAPIFEVPGGLLICIEAFQLFAKEHVSYKNWHTAQHSLLSLKMHRTGPEGTAVHRYPEGEGIIMAHSTLLPENLHRYDAKTGETHFTTVTAIALGQPSMHISHQGEWILATPTHRPHLHLRQPHD